ncbi:MAG: hypothetical protein KAH32_06020 [Chlamydiia bacterium]|nr:hypothetical protein [Chlamydiia bacterium]
MITLDEVQHTVNKAYLVLADLQYDIAYKEPYSGDVALIDTNYLLSTKIVALLEYINTLLLNITSDVNKRIFDVVASLNEITYKITQKWH